MTPEIPDWIIEYDKNNYQSSAGKAIRYLLGIVNTKKVVCPNADECLHDDPSFCSCVRYDNRSCKDFKIKHQ